MTSSRITNPRLTGGFTLIEMVFAMLLVGILGTFIVGGMGNLDQGPRYEVTKAKLEALRTAIFGDSGLMDAKGSRTSFGFVGDIGRVPSNLGELTTQGAFPAWTFSTQYGVGAGWRGPYLGSAPGGTSPLLDAWGTAIVYSTTGPMGNIASYGADKAAGGSVYNTDIVVEFPKTAYLSSVKGILTDTTTRSSGSIVELRYPVVGALTGYATTTDSNGYYLFNTVPFGVRAISVTGSRPIGPNTLVIDRSDFVTPDSALAYFTGQLSYISGSSQLFDTSTRIRLQVKSTYVSTLKLKTFRFTSSGGGTYSYLAVNGVDQTFSPALASGSQTDITPTMTVGPNSALSTVEILTSINQSGRTVTLVFTWTDQSTTDTISAVL